nr:DNA ligase 1-like isoform X4 [Coffea arabica]
MVSESELVNRLREILRTSDLDIATAGSVRRQLEEEFGVSLHDRKTFISEQIDLFLSELRNDDAQQQHREETQGDSSDDEEIRQVKVEDVKQVDENEDSGSHTQEVAIGKDEGSDGVRSKQKSRSHKKDKNEKKKGSGFGKTWAISPQLQEIVGVPEMARTEVVKRMWTYIRENNLQNPKDKRKIICDENLRGIFQVKSINMFQMNKALSKHMWPIDSEDEPQKHNTQQHQEDQEEAEEEDSNGEEMKQEFENLKQELNEGSVHQEVDVENEEESHGVRSKKRRSYKMDNNDKKKRSGFNKPWAISPQLQKIVGVQQMARTEVVKKMWVYIREKNLQNPKDKRKIICDQTLHGIFQVKNINMFQMNKALSKHMWPIDAEDDHQEAEEDGNGEETEEQSEDVKQEENEYSGSNEVDIGGGGEEEEEEEEESDGIRNKQKSRSQRMDAIQNKKGSGFSKPCAISPQLQELVGVPEMARTEVVKKMWAYIREKNLQNPKDKRKIICDEALRAIFRVNTINMFQMNKVLSKHIWPIDIEYATPIKSSQKKRQREKDRQ